MKRRPFVGLAAAAMLSTRAATAQATGRLRVAVVGHTGRGNYGHGLDAVWLKLPELAEIVAVADADSAGLANAQKRLRVAQGFQNYRDMLADVHPDIVAVCPRHPDQHHEMILASIESGARGIYCEKPFCRTPAEADAIAATCVRQHVKLAIGHRNRYHPTLLAVEQFVAEGGIGKLLEIRGRGKGDARGGGEDLWVLGSHVLNLFDYLGKGVRSCSAIIRQNGHWATPADVRAGNEGLGPIVGNELHARFELANGTMAYFDSQANDDTKNAAFGLQIIGSRGIIDFKLDENPLAHLAAGNPYQVSEGRADWVPISSVGPGKAETDARLPAAVASHEIAARDLIDSIHHDRQPLCDVHQAAMTIEMIHSVFASHRQAGKAVALPLASRVHALSGWG